MQFFSILDSSELVQTTSFTLVFSVSVNTHIDIQDLKTRVAKIAKFNTMDIYKSNYYLTYDCNTNQVLADQKDYYYLHLNFLSSSRQKLTVDKLNKNILFPKYYHYPYKDDYLIPQLVDRFGNRNNTKCVIYMLDHFSTDNKSQNLSHTEGNTTSLSTLNLEYHFWQIHSLNSFSDFMSYINDNNLFYFVDTLMSKYEALLNLKSYIPNSINNNIKIPKFIEEYLQYLGKNKTSFAKQNFVKLEEEIVETQVLEKEDPLKGSTEEEIKHIIHEDSYSEEKGLIIFSSNSIKNSRILNRVIKQKGDEVKRDNLKSSDIKSAGYKFLLYEKKYLNLPYKTGSPNKPLSVIYRYLSDDYKYQYYKYLSNTEKDNYLQFTTPPVSNNKNT